MALSGEKGPVRAGWSLVPGSGWLILCRWVTLVLPAGLVLVPLRRWEAPYRPYFTEHQGPLPISPLQALVDSLPLGLVVAALVATVLAVLVHQVLLAGALYWLTRRPERGAGSFGPWAVLQAVAGQGWRWFWPMMRVLAMSVALTGLGFSVIGATLRPWTESTQISAWTSWVLLPLLKTTLFFLWLALVGGWALWCRVMLVADARRWVHPLALRVGSVWRAFPWSGLGFFLLLNLSGQILGALGLGAWRQWPPAHGVGIAAYGGLWLLWQLVQAFIWHWQLRVALGIYHREELAPLRGRPDQPWTLRPTWTWIRRLPWSRRAP